MKSIKFKLLISVGIVVLAFSIILLNRSYNLIHSNIERLIDQQVGLALSYDLAIRDYFAEKVRPLMYRLVDEGDFIPETMSTSFVARNIFEKVSKDFPDYIIKFSARNPRNLANLAGPAELKMIKYFNDNPQETTWDGEIPMGGKQYFAKFSAMRMEETCLRCHGDPADAPASMKIIYGATRGFYLPLGRIVGLDTIAIPVDKINKLLWSETANNFIMLGFALMALIVSMVLILRFVVTNRLSRIAEHFERTTDQDENGVIEPIEVLGKDEISTVAESFNTLALKVNEAYRLLESKVAARTMKLTSTKEALQKAHDELEKRVRQRTIELSKANEQLKTEVEERKRAEEKIKSSLGEKEMLLREVHHRVKNNFEIISSLLDMSSMDTESRETQNILGDARARIYSMALIHSQLYQSNRFDQVNMEGHVQELVDHLSLVYADIGKYIEAVIEPSDLYLSVNQAIPCALVLNELVVNAYKHAFRVGDRGRVYISARRSTDNMVQIRVKDDGDGIAEGVDITKSHGLGLKLVKQLVTGQLKGKMHVNRDGGTEILIEFKMLNT